MSITLVAPQLSGGRHEARKVTNTRMVSANHIVLNMRDTAAATPSFAHEIITILLVERTVASLTVQGAREDTRRWMSDAADAYGVTKPTFTT